MFAADIEANSDMKPVPCHKKKGWQQYMDIDTFADWYIISEMAKNAETIWMTSYMTLKEGEKIMMGPLWDYDKSYGNFFSFRFPRVRITSRILGKK
jgi:hypothetical protein